MIWKLRMVKKKKKPKMKTVTEKVQDWSVLNENKAIWLRSKEDIEEEEYNKFYKSITKDFDDPASHIHFSAEGDVEFKAILFLPKKAAFDIFENYQSKPSSLRLYVRRVLIGDKFEDLIPNILTSFKVLSILMIFPLTSPENLFNNLRWSSLSVERLLRRLLK